MFADYQYAYVIGDFLIGFPVWIVLFYYRPDLRRQMLIAALLLGIVSVITEPVYLKDYWHPENGIAWRINLGAFFYGFFFGGVASVVYEVAFRKYFKRRRNGTHRKWLLAPLLILGAIMFIVPMRFGMNSIYTSSVAAICIACIFLFFRRDLFADVLMSSLLFGAITFFGYLVYLAVFPGIIQAWWDMGHISGIFIRGVPIEEILFAFGMGAVVGPAYEFFTGLEFKKR